VEVPTICVCGHSEESHRHFPNGDCSSCGCERYKPRPALSETDVIKDFISKVEGLEGVSSVEYTIYKTIDMRVYIGHGDTETEYQIYDLKGDAVQTAPTVYFNVLVFNGSND
jgi:hypothetical protein